MAGYLMRCVQVATVGHTVIASEVTPMVVSSGGSDFFCGGCATKLLSKVQFGQIRNLTFKCPACNRLNDVDLATPVITDIKYSQLVEWINHGTDIPPGATTDIHRVRTAFVLNA